jgi:hypothetical protein
MDPNPTRPDMTEAEYTFPSHIPLATGRTSNANGEPRQVEELRDINDPGSNNSRSLLQS